MTPTPEKQKPIEKTPAEIAAELEKKAQVLEAEGKASDARRKRGVAEKIRGLKTELELGSLQKTLPFHEAKDIEDARGNSTSVHPEVLATAAVGTAGIVAAIDKLDGSMEKTGLGKLGIKESIKEWITEELTEELDKDAGFFDKIIHKIKMMFLAPLAKMFGVDLTKKKGEGKEDGVIPEGEKGKTEEAKEGDNHGNKYLIATMGLAEIASEEAKKGGIAKIFPLQSVKDLTYQDLQGKAKDPRLLRQSLGLKNDITDDAIKSFAGMFVDQKNPLHKILVSSYEKRFPNKKIGDATIFEIVSSVGSDINFLKIIRNINIADYENSIKEATKNLFHYDEQKGEVSGDLAEKAKGLGFSKPLLVVLLSGRNSLFIDKNSLASLYDNPSLSTQDKEMLNKLGIFGDSFKQSIFTDERLNLGNGELMKKSAKIDMGSIVKSYILTGGVPSLDNMTTIEKIGAYTAFFMISTHTPETSGGVSGSIFNIENMMNIPKVFGTIPQDVQDTVLGMFSFEAIFNKIKEYGIDTAKYTKEFMQKSPGLSVVVILFVLFGPLFSPKSSLAKMVGHKK